ncbi:hypothetical protein ACIBO5_50535 [Nonomuraea angiospora]|uniref:hypothetical protein n=1 Tax=Nonomuraea angiospora TaxID=46172 RepID=UPI0029B21A6F|nr:hypothetical protein [Nonomuraea angiospora]MDX3099308.1 hypothetical protein [Nonomuraea angiospora]
MRPDGCFLAVGVPSGPAQILLWSHAAAEEQPGDGGRNAAPGQVILESHDVRKDFEFLRRRGVIFEQSESEDYPFGVRIEAVDPDGNRVSLRQQRKP